MAAAEAQSRKGRKSGPGADRLATAARLRALEKNIGVAVKRHRDPGSVSNFNPFKQGKDAETNRTKDERVVVMKGF
jgi:hypothetical protein